MITQMTVVADFFLGGGGQTKMSWLRHSTRENLSESRFRAVQCYDDPTMAVVADFTRSEGLAESETRLCSGRLPRPQASQHAQVARKTVG